eukprot:SAG31_NODE_37389_length_304_cov_1.512195_1_plen_34_part_01
MQGTATCNRRSLPHTMPCHARLCVVRVVPMLRAG